MGCVTCGVVASSCKLKLEIDFSFETELERDYLSRLQNSRALPPFQVPDIYITAKQEEARMSALIFTHFLLYIVVALPHLSPGKQVVKPHRAPAER